MGDCLYRAKGPTQIGMESFWVRMAES